MFDIIIIGAGISGMTAALYGVRGGKSVLLLESSSYGGQIINSHVVDNYPGINHIEGFTLMKNLYNQIMEYDVIYKQEEVIGIKNNNIVFTKSSEYFGKTIIIATGLKNRLLGLYGEKDFIGRGISYCATCDANFFRNKDVALVGGGNTAIEEAIYLSNIVNKVYLIHRRDKFRADNILVDRLKDINNIELVLNTNIINLIGEEYLNKIELDNGRVLDISCLFIAIGKVPDLNKFSDVLNLDEYGFVISDDTTTNLDNIFVAGDCRTKKLRQLITAASDGAIAATNAIEYLNNN